MVEEDREKLIEDIAFIINRGQWTRVGLSTVALPSWEERVRLMAASGKHGREMASDALAEIEDRFELIPK